MALLASILLASSDVRAGGVVHLKLKAHVSGGFFVAPLPPLAFEPARVTLSLHHHGMVYAHVIGMGPGAVVFAGGKIKPLKWHIRGPGGDLKVGPGGIKLKGPHGHGRGGGRIKLKF